MATICAAIVNIALASILLGTKTMFKVEERGDLFAAKATKADSSPTKAD